MKGVISPVTSVAAVIAVILLLVAVFLFIKARQGFRRYEQWRQAEPVRMEVDLSQPGRYTAPFHHTCRCSHGGVLFHLETHQAAMDKGEHANRFEGLKGKISLVDSAGEVVHEADFAAADLLASFDLPAPEGVYSLVVEVTEAAKDLEGMEQALTARYLLCGMEVMPAPIYGLWGMLSTLLGVGIVAGAVIVTLKRRASHDTGSMPGPGRI
jgi:hypothetical protein